MVVKKAKRAAKTVIQIGRARPTDVVVPIKVSAKTEKALLKKADGNGVVHITEADFREALLNYDRPGAEPIARTETIKIQVEMDDRLAEAINAEPVKSVLEIANDIIYGDREQAYGSPRFNLDSIAQFWSVYLRRKFPGPSEGMEFTGEDVAQLMILLKTARLIHNPSHKDSLVDQAGYAALQGRIQDL